MIADLFQAAPWLGWVALALLGLALLALAVILGRELAGLRREKRIERLRQSAIDAIATRDHSGALAVVKEVSALYAGRERLRPPAPASTPRRMRSSTWTTGSASRSGNC